MKKVAFSMAFILWAFLSSDAQGSLTLIPVAKNSKIEKELGFTITARYNDKKEYKHSGGFAGTTTFNFVAHKEGKLSELSRIILLVKKGENIILRTPLEISKKQSGEISTHFQLALQEIDADTIVLQVCNFSRGAGAVYQVDLRTYRAKKPSRHP